MHHNSSISVSLLPIFAVFADGKLTLSLDPGLVTGPGSFKMVICQPHNDAVLGDSAVGNENLQWAQYTAHALWAAVLGQQPIMAATRCGLKHVAQSLDLNSFGVDMAMKRWPRVGGAEADIEWVMEHQTPLAQYGLDKAIELYDGSFAGLKVKLEGDPPVVQIRSLHQVHPKNCGHHALVNASVMLQAFRLCDLLVCIAFG